jgi:hypothetical protein
VALLLLLLGTVLRTALLALSDALEVQCTTDDVVTDTRKVRYTTTTNQHDGVFLKVVAFTTDICPDFLLVCQADTSDLTER